MNATTQQFCRQAGVVTALACLERVSFFGCELCQADVTQKARGVSYERGLELQAIDLRPTARVVCMAPRAPDQPLDVTKLKWVILCDTCYHAPGGYHKLMEAVTGLGR